MVSFEDYFRQIFIYYLCQKKVLMLKPDMEIIFAWRILYNDDNKMPSMCNNIRKRNKDLYYMQIHRTE